MIYAEDAVPSMHDDVRFMYDYWQSKKNGDILPARHDIDPLDFWKYTPRVWMLDVEEGDPYKLFVRLSGSDIVEKAGINKTGKYMRDFNDGFEGSVGEINIFEAINVKKAVWYRGSPSSRHTQFVKNIEYIICPLSSDGVDVDKLFCYSIIDFSERNKLV